MHSASTIFTIQASLIRDLLAVRGRQHAFWAVERGIRAVNGRPEGQQG
jgi:hypothetical protein